MIFRLLHDSLQRKVYQGKLERPQVQNDVLLAKEARTLSHELDEAKKWVERRYFCQNSFTLCSLT